MMLYGLLRLDILVLGNDLTQDVAELAGAVEYTDCFYAEVYPPPNECPGTTHNNLIVRL